MLGGNARKQTNIQVRELKTTTRGKNTIHHPSCHGFFLPPPPFKKRKRQTRKKKKRNQRVCFPLVSIGNMHIAINAANINAPET